jgi:hypothetical protein
LLSRWNLPWCVGSNFNFTHFLNEILGEARFCSDMKFYDFIFEQGLMDLPLVRGTFMWSNNRDSPAQSRIDRFLVSPEWEAKFPNLYHKRLHRLCSDHFLIFLDCGGI